MRHLPRAMATSGNPIYRGCRLESRRDAWSWWAEERAYAESYGNDVIEGRLPVDAVILDLTQMIESDGYIHGKRLNAALSGLADALGIDAETEIECDRLWDAAGDDLSGACHVLDAAGYDGMRWAEQDREVAYLLIH